MLDGAAVPPSGMNGSPQLSRILNLYVEHPIPINAENARLDIYLAEATPNYLYGKRVRLQ